MDRREKRLVGLQQGTQWDRAFMGKLKDFENKEEARREAKHLKAYLKGYEKYTFGFEHVLNTITGKMETRPRTYEVQEKLIKLG